MKRVVLCLLLFSGLPNAFAQRVEVNKPVVLTGSNPSDRQLTGLGTPTDSTNAVSARVVQAGQLNYGAASGNTNAFNVTLQPAPPRYTAGMVVYFKANASVTGTATLNLNNLGVRDLKKSQALALTPGDITVGEIVCVIYDGSTFQLFNSAALKNDIADGNVVPYKQLPNQVGFPASGTWTVPAGITKIIVEVWGAGGGGGGLSCGSSPCPYGAAPGYGQGGYSAGGNGGSGGYVRSTLSVTPGETYSLSVGRGGCLGACGSTGPSGGTSQFGTGISATGGRGGSPGRLTNAACASPVPGGTGGTGGTGTGQFTLTGDTGQNGGPASLQGGSQSVSYWINGSSQYRTNEFIGFAASPANPAYIDAYFMQPRLKAAGGGAGNGTSSTSLPLCGDNGFILVSY